MKKNIWVLLFAFAFGIAPKFASAIDYSFVRSVGSYGSGNGQFYFPRGIISLPSGEIWVSDHNNGRIEAFTSNGAFIQSFGQSYLPDPTGMALTPAGNVLVGSASKITEFTSSRNFVQQFGGTGSGNGQFAGTVYGVTTDTSGNIWVPDAYNSRIQEFTNNGTFIRTFGSYGYGNGQLTYPEDVAIDASGNVWVADTPSSRIIEFTNTGTYVKTIGQGLLYGPSSLEFDSSGNLWVADTGHDRMVEFSSIGDFLKTFGTTGSGDGQLYRPDSFTWDLSGNMWIADGLNNRIVEYSPTPEPSTFVLLAIGAIGFLAYAWRRRRLGARCLSCAAIVAVVLAVGSAQAADVFNMGGTRNPTTGTWTGEASLEFVTVADPGNAADTAVMITDNTTGYGSVGNAYLPDPTKLIMSSCVRLGPMEKQVPRLYSALVLQTTLSMASRRISTG
jgi:sugar lactone lactonase YvrE